MTEVTAEGGLGRFDLLPGDIQIKIWNMAHQIYVDAATRIQAGLRRLRTMLTPLRGFRPQRYRLKHSQLTFPTRMARRRYRGMPVDKEYRWDALWLAETPQAVKDEIMRFVYYPGQ